VIYVGEKQRFKNQFKKSIDAFDKYPFKYLLQKDNKLPPYFTKPLFLSHQMTMLTPIYKRNDYSLNKVWNCYDWSVWVTCLLFILFLSIISMRLKANQTRSQIIISFLTSLWQYFKPVLRKGSSTLGKSRNHIYCLYLLTFFPVIIIFENELLSNLIYTQDSKLDTIDDFDSIDKIFMTTDFEHKRYIDYEIWKLNRWDDTKIAKKFNKFFKKVEDLNYFYYLIDGKKDLINLAQKLVFLEDEHRMKWTKV